MRYLIIDDDDFVNNFLGVSVIIFFSTIFDLSMTSGLMTSGLMILSILFWLIYWLLSSVLVSSDLFGWWILTCFV